MKDNNSKSINDIMILCQKGKFDQAEELCHFFLKQNEYDINILCLLGDMCLKQQKLDDAIIHYKKAIQIAPKHSSAYNNLGIIFQQKGQLNDAIASYEKAVQINPNYYEAYYNLGTIFHDLNQLDKAETNYKKSIEINANYHRVHNNLANLFSEQKKFDLAIIHFKKALQINPNYPQACNNLGVVLQKINKFHDAEFYYKKAIELAPNFHEAYSNLGTALQSQNKFDDASNNYKKAIKLNPNNHQAYNNLGNLQLSLFDFKNGWQNYKHRLQLGTDYILFTPSTTDTAYENQDLKNKVLYLYHEQGFGDTIMAARFIHSFVDMGAKVIFYVPKSLHKLLEKNFPKVEVITEAYQKPYDYHLPLMSAPMVLNINHRNVPLTNGYLSINDVVINHYKANVLKSGKQNIGIAWKGSTTHKNDHNRSFNLNDFLNKLDLNNHNQYYSLQKNLSNGEKQRLDESNIIDLGSSFMNFYDTATAVASLDALISVDTAIAHVGGALNIPTYIVLPKIGVDWRWGHQKELSYWYDSVTLIRDSLNRKINI
ncbi:tetratricopeptide repeat protein [Thiotrichales bacterium 19S11-10]|nr:tetratricopeptide repeat protein [Thiotrichales bacterium 19S11-10]